MTHNPHVRLAFSAICLILATISTASAEWKEKVLYSFQGGSDGQTPAGGLVFDDAGNLYGVTNEGGSTCPSPGCGIIFQLSPGKGGTWTETTLYGFNGTDGSFPAGSVIIDANNNLYGTAAYGGSGTCILLGYNVGCGVVYELSPPQQKGGSWTYSVLYNFQGGNDGRYPLGNLALDKAGSLFGATWYGGGRGDSCDPYYGSNCGTVFKLSPPKNKGGTWTEKVLYSFAGVANGQQVGDGADPNGGLILDSKGAVYGTTYYGGNARGECSPVGCGTVFKVIPPTKKGGAWKEKVLWSFNGSDGGSPGAGAALVFGPESDLFGTTVGGGTNGLGTAFELKPPSGKSRSWTETVLHRFANGGDGLNPQAGLVLDASGNLYGTDIGGQPTPRGVVFRLKAPTRQGGTWEETTLYSFTGGADGSHPTAGLIFDKFGNLYGTTQWGGTGTSCQGGCGTVFEVSP
jgi:hypothetical protein